MENNPTLYIATGPRPDISYFQRRWARARGIKLDGKHTQTVEENLFQPLTKASQAEFKSEAGNGLLTELRAIHSSPSFVCNIFDYWRDRSLEPLAASLGASISVDYFHFEVIHLPTANYEGTHLIGLYDRSPHLDVVFRSNEPKPFLSETSFTEPYMHLGTTLARDTFTKSYFSDSGEIWGRYGLARCEHLARRIHSGQENFWRLDARHLLELILGLVKAYGKGFTLLYLWYDNPSYYHISRYYRGVTQRAEIETFLLRLNGEINFRAMTYQELLQRMQGNSAIDQGYITYLKERYFDKSATV